MKRIDPIVIGMAAFTLVVLGGIALLIFRPQAPPIVQYSSDDPKRPLLEVGQTQFDFGLVLLNETKTQEVPVKNLGQSPLVFSDAVTSCDCTSIQLVINNLESKRFSMQRHPDWRQELLPGESGFVRIIYEPKIMPVKGRVSRQAVIKTNDPRNPIINFSFVAEVR